MKPIRSSFLGLAVAVLATVGFVGCSGSSQNQPGQGFAPNSSSSSAGSPSSSSSGSGSTRSGQGSSSSSSSFTRQYGYQPRSRSGSQSSSQPSSQPSSQSSSQYAQQSAQQPVTVTIPQGTDFRVALNQAISSTNAQAGDGFTATLLNPVRSGGQTIIPRNARVRGHVVDARASGRLAGVAQLVLTLDSVDISGKPVKIRTDSIARDGASHKKRDIFAIGGGTALGAIIGGIAGGGKGAAIGAAAGAGAGTAGAAITGKQNITLPVETTLIFRLTAPINLMQ